MKKLDCRFLAISGERSTHTHTRTMIYFKNRATAAAAAVTAENVHSGTFLWFVYDSSQWRPVGSNLDGDVLKNKIVN